jgi:hypothetical protein
MVAVVRLQRIVDRQSKGRRSLEAVESGRVHHIWILGTQWGRRGRGRWK